MYYKLLLKGVENVSNIDKGQQVYNLIKQGLSATNLRSKVISNNLANINTPGYKAYHVSFEDNLNASVDSLDLKVNRGKHLRDSDKSSNIQLYQDRDTSMKQDGNNVDIDNEMADQAANELEYRALITELNNRLAIKNIIIRGGR
ncbi:MAG: flagellar basal body rod protein FlgB [Clostridiaceae bacterium]|nr:flagellar basal body rod protein FlgB [Clostridiaceae bacterium]